MATHAPPVFEQVTTPDGVRVSVGEWGNPAGPEILLIHGQAQSHLSFTRQINSDLARDFRLVDGARVHVYVGLPSIG